MFKLLLCLSFTVTAVAQDFSSLGFNSQIGAEKKTVRTVEKEKISSAPKACSSKDQTSVPLQILKSLMIYKTGKVEAYPSSSGDILNVKASSKIIGNCNSMLEPKLTWSSKHNRYLYEVKIRKTCNGDKCSYPVSQKVNGEIKVVTKEYEPRLSGLYKCLEDNIGTVKKNGVEQWDTDKFVKKDLETAQMEAPITSDLYFVSRGPLASQLDDKKKNLIENKDCDFFEDISENGFVHYSREDVKNAQLAQQAQALCKGGSYKAIEESLDIFANNEHLYDTLMTARDELLLAEIKKYKERFSDAAEEKNLHQLDSKQYKELMKDFYELIVDKNISTKNHTSEDAKNSDLIVNILAEIKRAVRNGDKELLASLKEKLAKRAAELSQYMESPYFTTTDYRNFIDLKLKPNFESNDWATASKDLHKSIITLKLLCEAYGGDKEACAKHKGTNFSKKKSTLPSLKLVSKKADAYNKVAVEEYKEKYKLIKDPKRYKSLAYKEKLLHCTKHKGVSNQYAQGIQSITPQIQQACQRQARGSQHSFQLCLDGYQGQIRIDVNSLQGKMEDCKKNQASYKQKATKWASLENDRDIYLNLSEKERLAKQQKAEKLVLEKKHNYNFAFKGINRISSPRMPSSYYPSQQYSQRYNSVFDNYSMRTPGFNPNANFNANLNTNYNLYSSPNYSTTYQSPGTFSNFNMNQNYYPYQNNYMTQAPYWSNQTPGGVIMNSSFPSYNPFQLNGGINFSTGVNTGFSGQGFQNQFMPQQGGNVLYGR